MCRRLLLATTLWAVASWWWRPFGINCLVAFQFQAPRPALQRLSFSQKSSSSPFSLSFRKTNTVSTSSSSSFPSLKTCPTTRSSTSTSSSALFSGTGIATNYTWKEEAFEIEVSVKVPRETLASDIYYKATSTSIDLRLKKNKQRNSNNDKNDDSDDDIILLDGNRKMRGRISLDGTFWVISDYNDVVMTTTPVDDEEQDIATTTQSKQQQQQKFREVTVTIEKLLKSPKNSFEVIDYDWKGVYPNDKNEVIFRKYDVPEELNVREYAQTLGVDIDHINMSMVDKTMYSSGLNITQSSLDELTKAGLIKEVTRQNDGSEYTINTDSGELEPYSPLNDKQHLTTTVTSARVSKPSSVPKIPFLDTDSPWDKTQKPKQQSQQQVDIADDASSVAVQFDKETNQTVIRQTREFTRSAFAQDAAAAAAEKKDESTNASSDTTTTTNKKNKYIDVMAKDPIDLLTVTRLKEILKSQGQKVSGTKKELQDRLRQQVNTLLQGQQEL